MSPPVDDDAPLPLPPIGLRSDVARLPWSSRLFSALTVYLPVFLMAILAAFTWWLVKQAPEPESPHAARPLSHDPDYEMSGFSVRRQSAGDESAGVVEGDRVRHFPDTDTLEIEQVRLRWRDADGQVVLATASQAIAKADGSELVLQGNARVERLTDAPAGSRRAADEQFEFRSESLHVDARARQVRTDRPVTLVQGGSRFEAGSLAYDDRTRTLDLGGPVRGRLASRR